ncbi:MAG: hypothetical protein MUF42_11040 [Cytophagaceae bacterium]|jgi:hypothetical protein|nr:hypothetical protein [Cytophagaceae bacterium]
MNLNFRFFIPLILFALNNYSFVLHAQVIDGIEFGWKVQSERFSPREYTDYYQKFYYPNELMDPNSLDETGARIGRTSIQLVTVSFVFDSLLYKPDSASHSLHRLKLGIGAGRGKMHYYNLKIPNTQKSDSMARYKIFEDVFRIQAEYQYVFGTHKRIQGFIGTSIYTDLKIASLLAKDGIRNFVYDADQKVIVKKYADLGLAFSFGVRIKVNRQTYWNLEWTPGFKTGKDHLGDSRQTFTNGFQTSISVNLPR